MKLKELISNFGGGYYKHLIIGICLLLVIGIFLITLKDSYAYYGGSNELPIIEATIGKLKPTIDKVYIEAENQLYTNNPKPSVTIAWTDDNITEYCVTTKGTCSAFTQLSDTNSKSVTVPITLNGEGNHILYAYIKNKYGYTSEVKSDTITLDTTAPTISSLSTTEINETSATISFEGNDAISGVSQYCYSTTNSNYTCNDMNREEIAFTISGLESGKSYTVSVYLIDNAGNEGKSSPKTHTFKTTSKTAGDVIIATSKSLESEDELTARNARITSGTKDDLRRFVGSYTDVADNFICFGTADQNQCKNNMDTYMYRIIGVDASDRLKIIKATKIVKDSQTTFQWHSTYSSNTKWNSSSLYTGLNNGYFMQNAKYNYMQDQKWTNLIDPSTYYIGDSTASTNPTLFQNERGENFTNARIGLMYLSDYLYASGANTSNWLFIANGLNGNHSSLGSGATAPSAEIEWTMTRYGKYSGCYSAWFVNSYGVVTLYNLTNAFAVRPVFYIDSSKINLKGTGIITDPYYITNVN